MGFLGLRRPNWRHADAEIRLQAVANLPECKQDLLATLARQDADLRVRQAAIGRLQRVDLLTGLLAGGDAVVARVAGERLAALALVALRSGVWAAVGDQLERITDQKSLAELCLKAQDDEVRSRALARLLAQAEPSQTLLATVAIQDGDGRLGLTAVAAVAARGDLRAVAAKAKVPAVRAAAQARLDRLVQDDRPSPEQVRQGRLKAVEPLVAEALRLAVGSDWAHMDAAWSDLRARFSALSAARPEVPADARLEELAARIARAEADHRRRAGEAAERRAGQLTARAAVLAELAALPAPVEPVVWRQRWQALPAVDGQDGDAQEAQFQQLLAERQPQAAPPVDLLSATDAEALAALSAEAEGLLTAGREARFRFQELHKSWSRLAGDLAPQDPRRLRFLTAWQAWKTARTAAMAERSAAREERLGRLLALVRDAEALAAAEVGAGAADHDRRAAAVQDLRKRWRAVGAVPPRLIDGVRERFRAACDAAWAPVAAGREALAWERSAHLGHAEELIAGVEALAAVDDLAQVASAVKKAHVAWKKLGSLPKDKGQAAWLRFKAVCDAQFERCAPWFAEQDAARAANLAAKRELVAATAALVDAPLPGLTGSPAESAEHKRRADAVAAARERWQAIGPVPREADRELWQAWRAVLDRHFGQRRAAWDARHAEQVDNLNRKLGLIAEARTLAEIAEAGIAEPGRKKPDAEIHARLRDLQATWKHIGHVPRDQVEATWDTWRTTCDRIYATLKDHLAAQEAERQANLTAKLALIAEVEELHQLENPHWYKDDVREAQHKWREIGHIPRERMDEVNQRFRAACDRILQAG